MHLVTLLLVRNLTSTHLWRYFMNKTTLRHRLTAMIFTALMVISFSKCVFADVSVPYGFPAEKCLEMMHILVDEYGLSPEGAASVLGNVAQESMFKGDAYSGYYYGICQWDPNDRWPLICAWTTAHGYDIYDPIGQLHAAFSDEAEQYRYSETLQYMKSVSSIEDGVHRWIEYYEGATGQEESERCSYSYMVLELYREN